MFSLFYEKQNQTYFEQLLITKFLKDANKYLLS